MPLPETPLDSVSSDVAIARSFDRHYGFGLNRTVSLGGGGLFLVAWQIAYLTELASSGLEMASAERVIGTSAGSLVASVIVSGRLRKVHAEIAMLARAPAIIEALAPTVELHPSQQRALEMFHVADNAAPATVKAIGHAALAADTPSPTRLRRTMAIVTGRGKLSSERLFITAVDAFTGERCALGTDSGTTLAAASAASSAVPGLFPPQPIGDRRLMDGGVSGTGVHLDLLAGARRALVLSLTDRHDSTEAMMTNPHDALMGEITALEASGAEVYARSPDAVDLAELMSPTAVPKAMEMGTRQAQRDAAGLSAFWR